MATSLIFGQEEIRKATVSSTKRHSGQHFNRITDRLDAKKNPNYKAGPADFSIAELTELVGLSQ